MLVSGVVLLPGKPFPTVSEDTWNKSKLNPFWNQPREAMLCIHSLPSPTCILSSEAEKHILLLLSFPSELRHTSLHFCLSSHGELQSHCALCSLVPPCGTGSLAGKPRSLRPGKAPFFLPLFSCLYNGSGCHSIVLMGSS